MPTGLSPPNRLASLSGAIALSLLGANMGYSDYLSIPIGGIVLMVVVLYIFGSAVISNRLVAILLIGAAVSVPILAQTLSLPDSNHTTLSHLREFFFLIILVYASQPSQFMARAAMEGLRAASVVISVVVLMQSIQIRLGMIAVTVPEQWMMLDYGNSLQNAILHNFDYIRPVAFYSEPTVVASILVPSLFCAGKYGDRIWSFLCIVGVVLTQSMLGYAGSAVVLWILCKEKPHYRSAIVIIGLASLSLVAGTRLATVLAGEDLSLQWRFTLPLEYLINRLESDPFTPISTAQILIDGLYFYENASITDNWPLYTLIRLGYLGVVWIAFCASSIPRNTLLLFAYMAIITGAPLYQDKVLIMLVFMWATQYVKTENPAHMRSAA